jgi:hypothetical protein
MAARMDFWGDVAASAVRTPVAILREQAALLGAKTKNLIEATVYTESVHGSFRHLFNLIVPGLDNYTYNLFAIDHDIDLYPITVLGTDLKFDTEEAFTDWLRNFLSSNKTKQIVGNLLAQVAS